MGSFQSLTLSVNPSGICHVGIDVPGKTVNLLSPEVLDDLSRAVDSIASNPGIVGTVFLSLKEDHFIGGAEINVARFLADRDLTLAFVANGRKVFQRISEMTIPTLAAVHGACLGGGLELALACRYRLATDHRKTRLGFPEVLLGILPAWGGTTRLPRLIGLAHALDLLLTGRQLDAPRAERIGLVDRVITPKAVEIQAERFLLERLRLGSAGEDAVRRARFRSQRGILSRVLNHTGLGNRIVIATARRQVLKRTEGRYPAPLKILEVLREGFRKPLREALSLEESAIESLLKEKVTQNLLHIFEMRQAAGRIPKEAPRPPSHTPMMKVGVLGAGVMGAGIAHIMIMHDLTVRMRDMNEEALLKGLREVHRLLEKPASRRPRDRREVRRRFERLSTTVGYAGFGDCDLVIEAVAERIEIKRKVLRDLQEAAGDRPFFATNTSSLSVSLLAEAAKRPDRVLGLHFFNPVERMPLVEVIRGRKTSEEALAAGVAFVKQIGKTPLIVGDGPGFLVNRILMAYANEAGMLLEEGSPIDSIDRAMERFGMPMGPFKMMDIVGLDIAHHTAESIRSALKLDPVEQSRIGAHLFGAGRLGRKTGSGFYQYGKGGRRGNPSDLAKDLRPIREARAVHPLRTASESMITDRLILIMANTAAACLEEGVVSEPGAVDLGLILGAGFPPFRGGLLRYCDTMGAAAVNERLTQLASTFGRRYFPHRRIRDLAAQGKGFYTNGSSPKS